MSARSAAAAERYAAYCALRDEGMRVTDAARELGIEHRTASRLERSYRLARGLETGRQDAEWSQR